MTRNKRKENANHYYDPRVLENYFRNDIFNSWRYLCEKIKERESLESISSM